MKKIFLYAYDKQNLGDDLFVHVITKRYPHVKFYMWSDKLNCKVFGSLPNLRIIDKDSAFVRFLNKLRPSLVARYKGSLERRADAVVYIGGSIFMEYPNWEQISVWWEYEAENRPFYVLGANFGPYHTEAYREKMATIFQKMGDVCFRDQYSYELFNDISTVRYAPDILFSYPMPKMTVKEKQIFVSVIDCACRDESHGLSEFDSRYVSNMAGMLRGYLNNGYRLVLSSFCKEEGDEMGIAKILAAMGCENHPSIQMLSYNGTNSDELTSAISESEFVIATRFHATIMAMAAGRPVLPIIYSDKTKHVLDDLNYSGLVYDLRKDESWISQDMAKSIVPICPNYGHFDKLDQLLK